MIGTVGTQALCRVLFVSPRVNIADMAVGANEDRAKVPDVIDHWRLGA